MEKREYEMRAAVPADLDQLLALLRLVDTEFVPPLSQRRPLEDWAGDALCPDKCCCYVAVGDDAQLVAVCGAFHPYEGDLDQACLNLLATRPAYRRTGVGVKLRWRVLEALRERGVKRVRTRTWSTNHTMLRINTEMGFREDYVVRDERGPGTHSIYFVKTL